MDEDEKKPAQKWTLGSDLERYGLEELEDYAAALRTELARVEAAKAGKRSHLSDAAKLFKS